MSEWDEEKMKYRIDCLTKCNRFSINYEKRDTRNCHFIVYARIKKKKNK